MNEANDTSTATTATAPGAAPQESPGMVSLLARLRTPPDAQATPRPLDNVTPMLGSGQRAVSRQQAGVMLGVSWRTIERLVDRGELRAFKLLGQWRILVADIDAYVAQKISEQNSRIGA